MAYVNTDYRLARTDFRTARAAWTAPIREPSLAVVKPDLSIDDWQRRVGRVIVELRLLRGITQEELAAEVGRSTAALSRWETGKAGPSLWDAYRLAVTLDAPPELLVNPPELPRRVSPLADFMLTEGATLRVVGETKVRPPGRVAESDVDNAARSGMEEGMRRARARKPTDPRSGPQSPGRPARGTPAAPGRPRDRS